MNLVLGPKQSRAVAFGLLLAVLWLLLELTVLPLLAAHRDYDRQLDSLASGLARYTQQEAEREQLSAALARRGTAEGVTDGYLKAATAPLASAELQAAVKRLVEARQGQLVSVQSLPVVEDEGFSRVTVRVHLRCPLECLRQLFYQLESGDPQLFLDKMVLTTPLQRRGVPGTADRLDADFQLSGYLRG